MVTLHEIHYEIPLRSPLDAVRGAGLGAVSASFPPVFFLGRTRSAGFPEDSNRVPVKSPLTGNLDLYESET